MCNFLEGILKCLISKNYVSSISIFYFQIAYNIDIDSINNDKDDSFNSMFNETIDITMRHFGDIYAEINPWKLKDRARLKKIVSLMRKKGYEMITERLNNSDSYVKDILSKIIDACSI